ncbi:MAG TPA: hypothetical protein VIK35_05495 [Verrucomicrobiae bacterium]
MQIKKPLRYFSESHAVYQEVELHFLKKKIELPPEWEDLVAIACFPNQVIEQKFCHGFESEQDSTGAWVIKRDTKTGHPVKAYRKETPFAKELLAFQACFARDADLTLEILTLARKCLARYDEKNCDTQDGRVRAFLVKYGNSAIISDSGKLRLPKKNEFAEWTNAELFQGKRKELKIKIVPVAPLQDGQIAALLTDHYRKIITTASVTQARRSVSVAYTKKGKPYYFAKGLLKGKI